MVKCASENATISCIMRLAVAVLFGVAAYDKFAGGLENVVISFQTMFQDTWLPMPLVVLHARLTPWIEAVIALWLISGIKLKCAWTFAALFTISLAFGMLVAKQIAVVANNYFYVLLCCVGLYFSQYDTCSIDKLGKK